MSGDSSRLVSGKVAYETAGAREQDYLLFVCLSWRCAA